MVSHITVGMTDVVCWSSISSYFALKAAVNDEYCNVYCDHFIETNIFFVKNTHWLSRSKNETNTVQSFNPSATVRHVYTSLTLPKGMTRRGVYTGLHAWGKSPILPLLVCSLRKVPLKNPSGCCEFSIAGTNSYWHLAVSLSNIKKSQIFSFLVLCLWCGFLCIWFYFTSHLWHFSWTLIIMYSLR